MAIRPCLQAFGLRNCNFAFGRNYREGRDPHLQRGVEGDVSYGVYRTYRRGGVSPPGTTVVRDGKPVPERNIVLDKKMKTEVYFP